MPRTHETLTAGIEQGLHLGAQLYVSLETGGGEPIRRTELVVGERAIGQAMTPDTLMIWLSSTKPITAVAVAQLWERGLLELDDPVARHVPEFGVHGKERVTVRHLLTHTGGIRKLNVGWPEASWDEIIDFICRARPEPRWVLGEKAGYHLASSWFLLGELVRRLDGRHFRRYVREEIFEPLGMRDSWVGMPREKFEAYGDRLGRMYSTENGRMERAWNREAHVVGCSPGGNGYGPIRELGRFYEMLLSRGRWQDTKILSPQTVEAMTVPHRVGMHDQTFKHKLDWGLGFIVNSNHYGADLPPYGYGRHASRRTFGHSGFQSSTGFADPEHGLVVALVTNGNPGEPRHTERFRDATEAIYEDLRLAS
ncbi:MAG: beta-lactamase family protein [bacterium]|nr:beta-lactamase family protein [bacterium]